MGEGTSIGLIDLPQELQLFILSCLTSRDLSCIAVASRHFYGLCCEPSLWANAQPTKEVLEREGLSVFLLLPRFSLLKELDLSYLDLTREATETIASLPSRFNSLRLRYTILSSTQRSALVKSCGSKKARGLSSLDLDSVPLGKESVSGVISAVCQRKVVGLSNSGLRGGHLEAILSNLETSSLNSLTLAGLNMTEVDPTLFQAAALHIGFLSLANSTLLVEQLQALMQAVLWSSSLDSLDLTGCNFDGVEAQLLGDAAAALSSLSLTAAKLDVKHISSLLHALPLPSSALDHLSLATLDLSSTPSNLLARCLSSVASLNLSYCRLSTEQLTGLMRSLGKAESLVQTLQLARTDLTALPSGVLERAATRLLSIDLSYCPMTPAQTLALTTACCKGLQVTLVRVDMTQVPSSVFFRAIRKGLTLRYPKLTKEQHAAVSTNR